MNANKEIELLFKNHNLSIEEENGKLFVNSENKIAIDSRISQKEHENGWTSRLDVRIELPNGQAILESFGDIGDDSETAKNKNIQNFALNSFHTIAAYIYDDKEDEQITYETWHVDENEWEVFIGNFGMKNSTNEPVEIPEKLFDLIEILIKQNLNQATDYYWARFFFAQYDQEISSIEFLINNESYEEGQMELSKLPWELRDEYYSIRNFIIVKKKAAHNKS